ncbi:hypothetical protein LSUB1_G006481 [Lachnellula subtilissima]|uniref:Uncharacterized protein n=1 Tax=Lachnellula subtilissima TaxID=602034 RepID=A0A8H8RBE7_9HELO|nr:hypothetical protein LSUB1_G006481 [Lachnellula subtilissima]
MPDSTGIGVGLAGYSGARRFTSLASFKDATRLGPNRDIKVYIDNQAAIYRLARPSDNPGQSQQIRAIAAAAKVAQNGSTLAIEWLPKVARSTASAFFQLKLKHGYFSSYLKSEYKAERYILRQNVPFRLSMQSLFETKIGR